MPTENTGNADFLRDVATHELTIIRNEGLYRHLRFSRPGSSCMYFDLIEALGGEEQHRQL